MQYRRECFYELVWVFEVKYRGLNNAKYWSFWHRGVICIPHRQTVVQWPKPPLSLFLRLGAKVQAKEDFCHAEQLTCGKKNICVLMNSELLRLRFTVGSSGLETKGGSCFLNLSVSSVLGCACQPQYCPLILMVGRVKCVNIWARAGFRRVNHPSTTPGGITLIFKV